MITRQEKISNDVENPYPCRAILMNELPIMIFAILTVVGVLIMMSNPDLFFGDPWAIKTDWMRVKTFFAAFPLIGGVVGLTLTTLIKVCDIARAAALSNPRYCRLK